MNLLRVGVLLFKGQQLWFGKSALMYIILSLDNFTRLLLLLHLSKTGEVYFPITQFSVPTNLFIYLLLLSFFLGDPSSVAV